MTLLNYYFEKALTSALGLSQSRRARASSGRDAKERRAFIELMDQKGWDTPDIIMEEFSVLLGE
jgi:hypothetical protein